VGTDRRMARQQKKPALKFSPLPLPLPLPLPPPRRAACRVPAPSKTRANTGVQIRVCQRDTEFLAQAPIVDAARFAEKGP
jgi:hypothetical protein